MFQLMKMSYYTLLTFSQYKEIVTAFSANKNHGFLINYFSHSRLNMEVQKYYTFMLEICFKLKMLYVQ